MSQAPDAMSAELPGRSFSWREAWTNALTRPSVATFEELAGDPRATAGRAYLWIAAASIIGVLVQIVLVYVQIQDLILPGYSSLVLSSMMTTAVGLVVASLVAFLIASGAAHLVARLLGGRGTYSALAFAYASYSAPLTLINYVLGGLPLGVLLNCVTVATGLYALVLAVTAVRAVHQIDTGKAIVAALAIPFLFVCLAVGIIVLLAILGPAVGNIFSEIISNV